MVRRRTVCATRARRCAGQALVESVIALLALFVVLYGIVIVGKRADIAHGAILGSRYAAWERTVWAETGGKPDRQIALEIRNRVFAAPAAPVGADDGHAVSAAPNPLWTRADGSAALAAYSDGEISMGSHRTPGLLFSTVTDDIVKVYNEVIKYLSLIGGVHPAPFKVNVDGRYDAVSQPVILAYEPAAARAASPLDLARFPELAEVRMARRPVVLVADTWSVKADGKAGQCGHQPADTTVCQVATLTPTNLFSGWVNKVMDVIGYVAVEFKQGEFQFGYVDPTATPDYSKGSDH